MTGLRRQTINAVVAGGDLKMTTLVYLSQALNVPMSYWFGEEPTVMPGKTLEQKYIEALEEIRDLHKEIKNIRK